MSGPTSESWTMLEVVSPLIQEMRQWLVIRLDEEVSTTQVVMEFLYSIHYCKTYLLELGIGFHCSGPGSIR